MKTMKIDQTIPGVASFKDKKGNPALVDGVPVWGVTDEKVGKVEASEDGLTAVFTALNPGSCKLILLADVDRGEGVKEVKGESEEIIVLALEAVTIGIELGEPKDAEVIPEPAPVEVPAEPVPAPVAKKSKK